MLLYRYFGLLYHGLRYFNPAGVLNRALEYLSLSLSFENLFLLASMRISLREYITLSNTRFFYTVLHVRTVESPIKREYLSEAHKSKNTELCINAKYETCKRKREKLHRGSV